MVAQAAPQESISIGEIRITYLPDGEGHMAATGVFPASTEEAWQAHQQFLDEDGRVVTNLGGFLIQTGDRNIIVDLAFGDHTVEVPDFATFVGGRYLDSLKQTGVARRTRDSLLAELEGSATIVSGSHFTGSVFGRVLPGQGKRLWQGGL